MTEEKPTYYSLHRERILAERKIYNQNNKERNKEYQREYFQKNKAKITERHKKWRQLHPKPPKPPKEKKEKKKDTYTPPTPSEVISQLLLPPPPDPEPTVTYINKPIIVTFD